MNGCERVNSTQGCGSDDKRPESTVGTPPNKRPHDTPTETMDRWLYGWALGYASVGAGSLLIPLYALTLGGGPLLVGVLASTAAFAGVPGAILWGRIVTKTERRRPFVLVALGAVSIVLALTPLTGTPWGLVIANSALWFVVSAAAPVLNLIVVSGAQPDEWESRIGRLNTYQGYGWVGGLVVGTVWTAIVSTMLGPARAQEFLFVVLGAVAAVGFVIVRIWYPEPSDVSEGRFRSVYRRLDIGATTGRMMRSVPIGPGRAYWALTSVRRRHLSRLRTPIRSYFAAVGVFSLGFAVFWAPMPAYLADIGLETAIVFVLFLLANVGSAGSFNRIGAVSARFGSDRTQIAALGARVVLFPAVAIAGGTVLGFPLLSALLVLIGITWAAIAITTTGTVVRLAPTDSRAEALGFYTATIGFGTGIGSIVGGVLAAQTSYLSTFLVAGSVVLVGTVLGALSMRVNERQIFAE